MATWVKMAGGQMKYNDACPNEVTPSGFQSIDDIDPDVEDCFAASLPAYRPAYWLAMTDEVWNIKGEP